MTGTRIGSGAAGQALAVLVLVLVLALVWQALVLPLVTWHADRGAELDRRVLLANRMEALAASLPALRAEAGRRGEAGAVAVPVLDGATDAVAGAALQQKLGDMAGRAEVALTTAELLPAEPAGAYRRVRLRIAVQGPWPNLVTLLDAIAAEQPGMVVDDAQIHAAGGFIDPARASLNATWTVMAFRSGAGP